MASCEICNRRIEPHLRERGKRLCFSCLTEQVSESGSVSTFNLKQKPIQAPCSLCDRESSGAELVPSPWGFICKQCCDICETQSGVPWAIVTSSAQKEWLLKANTKILGPYTSGEVEDLLRDHRVVAHDEIVRPASRWHLMRDEEQFRLVLNEVKNRQLNSKKAQDVTANTISGTMTPHLEEIVRERAFHAETLLEGLDKQMEREATVVSPPRDASRDLLKTYASSQDQRLRHDVNQVRQRRLWLGLVLLLIAGIFVALRFTQPHGGSADSRDIYFQELMDSGLSAEKIGNYSKALIQYSEARTLRPDDPELLLHLAPLALVYDKQMLQAQRMFKELLSTVKEPNYQRSSYLGLGLIALESHDYDGARDAFQKARTIDADYMPALANLGILAFFRDDFHDAEDFLLKAIEKGSYDGAVVISLADVYISESGNNATGGRAKLNNAHNLLDQFLQLSRDYQQEVLIEDARVMSLEGKLSEAAHRVETFLDIDPDQTELHLHDWGVYRERASWGLLLDTFKKVAGELAPSPRLTAALGLAMYRGREKLEGAQTIEQALTQSPKDPLLMALAGWVELKLGRKENGAVNIKQAALLADHYKLPHILQARLCQEEKDFDCAKKEWDATLRLDSRSVEALHGLALNAWYHHDRDLALNYLTQLYANDPYYIPYLQLLTEIRSAPAATK